METHNQNVRYLIIGVLALIIVGVVIAIIVLNNNDSPEESATTEQESTSIEQEPVDITLPEAVVSQPINQQEPSNEPTDSSPTEAVDSPPTDVTTSQSPARYTDYTTAAFNQALQENKNVVLFFHASWCPTCKVLDEDIQNGLSRVPANTEILKVDYDSSNDLKREYNINYQHTLVFLGGDGTSSLETLQGATFDEMLFIANNRS